MLYSAHELSYQMLAPARYAAGIGAKFWRSPLNPMAESWLGRTSAAALDVFENATRRYPKPEWDLRETVVNGSTVPVLTELALSKPFGDLLRFRRNPTALAAAKKSATPDPKVLIVAPLSGHYSTLLRGTVEAMLPGHDVYITDWRNARMVPLSEGRFDLNDYIDYLIEFLHAIGEPAHAMAVCQPGPALLSATAVMAANDDYLRPLTITIMGSPIDARRSPTVPNVLAQERPFDWFERNMIYTVPAPYPGVMRRVYPGFVQLYSFLSMNQDRHTNAHYEYFLDLVKGDGDSADKHRAFYDEYLSVLDLTEEFYLQTIREVFQEHTLAEGKFMHRGVRVDPGAIRDVGLMTVEGENDDISGIGQTQAAHDLCVNLDESMRIDHVQPGVGHYGVFNGSRWRTEIQPKIAGFIRTHHKPETRVLPVAAE
ncbi:MAG: polyhydroxyalkanoate depolymerase [Alphaproteobacteria bacterium]|nr:polyhydroxyalkanoate depolymerase [Alphaproteobacteria bacterium]